MSDQATEREWLEGLDPTFERDRRDDVELASHAVEAAAEAEAARIPRTLQYGGPLRAFVAGAVWGVRWHLARAVAATPAAFVHYAPNMRRGIYPNLAPTGWPQKRNWHAEAIADAGTSHVLVGRPYVIACEWCPAMFMANTKNEAMAMFRQHESEQLTQQHATEPERR